MNSKNITTSINTLMEEFESRWGDVSNRLPIVPGKIILSALNKYLQEIDECNNANVQNLSKIIDKKQI